MFNNYKMQLEHLIIHDFETDILNSIIIFYFFKLLSQMDVLIYEKRTYMYFPWKLDECLMARYLLYSSVQVIMLLSSHFG